MLYLFVVHVAAGVALVDHVNYLYLYDVVFWVVRVDVE